MEHEQRRSRGVGWRPGPLGAGILLAWQQRGQADPRQGQAVAIQDALDGARGGMPTGSGMSATLAGSTTMSPG